jgi:hypothetical protein
MKIIALLSTLAACCSAFAPSSSSSSKAGTATALNAEMSRMAFVSAAAASVFGVAVAQPAFAMDQENIDDPTEQWETGSPTASAKELRKNRFTAARTQNNSNYPPIKRLTLERKSPVVRFLLAAEVALVGVCPIALLSRSLTLLPCSFRPAWTLTPPTSRPTRRRTPASSSRR